MRRIGGERQVHLVAVELAVGRGAEVILHVARAFDLVGRERAALELVEDRAVRLAHHLREHVQAAAMRHADHDLLHAERAAALDDLLERGNHRLRRRRGRSAWCRGNAGRENFSKPSASTSLLQDRALALAGEGDLLVRTLDALLNPRLLGRIGDVHELEADRPAIGAAQDREHLADRRVFETEHVVDEDLAVVIGLGEAVGGRMQLLVILLSGSRPSGSRLACRWPRMR